MSLLDWMQRAAAGQEAEVGWCVPLWISLEIVFSEFCTFLSAAKMQDLIQVFICIF